MALVVDGVDKLRPTSGRPWAGFRRAAGRLEAAHTRKTAG